MRVSPLHVDVVLWPKYSKECTGTAEVVGSNPAQSLKIFSGLCSSSVTAAFALLTVITHLLLNGQLFQA